MSRDPDTDLQELAERVAVAIGRLVEAQVSVPDDSTVLSADHPTVTDALSLLAETLAILDDVGARSESDERFTDLAFLARLELGASREDLRSVAGRRKTWQALGLAASVMSRSQQALVALERELCAAMERKPPKRPGELAESLEIRAHYALLRDWVAGRQNVGPASLLGVLAQAGEQLRRLQQLDIYPLMRIEDRRQVRSLLERIAAARERATPDRDAETLWRDLEAASQLLLQINNRGELIEHDLRLLEDWVAEEPGTADTGGRTCGEIASRMGRLLGRDRPVDEVLLRPTRHSLDEGRRRLEHLRARLSSGFA